MTGPVPSLELLELEEEQLRRIKANRLALYAPYPKQKVFHEAGRLFRERMLKAGNQQGKTLSAGAEVAMHLTGLYPDWWNGKRFAHPVACWAAGVTSESTRDNPQRILMGAVGQIGTGMIPEAKIINVSAARGVADAIDTVQVRHIGGGISTLKFKSYEKGREKWQGDTLHVLWLDEEPPQDIYIEGITRTNATRGIVLMTYTPLLGMSEVTRLFLETPSAERHVTNMTIHDALHYTDADRERIIDSYPPHEREARINGTPMMGSGRVFPIPEEKVSYDPGKVHPLPTWFRHIAGIDFGWDHPTAVVWVGYDPEADCAYVYDAYRVRESTPIIHAAAIRARGPWIPIAWPHDGLQHEKGTGDTLAQLYRQQGLRMLDERATFTEGGNGVEAGLLDMLDRMQTGRLKVAAHLHDWWEEFRLYHRKDGRVVKLGDDLMSATRYALMMLRFSATPSRQTTSFEPGMHTTRNTQSAFEPAY